LQDLRFLQWQLWKILSGITNVILISNNSFCLLSLIRILSFSTDVSFAQLTGDRNIFQLLCFSVSYCNLNSAVHENLFCLEPTALKTRNNATNNDNIALIKCQCTHSNCGMCTIIHYETLNFLLCNTVLLHVDMVFLYDCSGDYWNKLIWSCFMWPHILDLKLGMLGSDFKMYIVLTGR
jgi:hypothetical protein